MFIMKTSLPKFAFALLLTTLLHVKCQAQNTPKDYIAVHNAARAAVGVGPLAWSDTVAAYAQQYANQRAADCRLVHSNTNYGENIAEGSGSYGALSGVDGVKLWINEKSMYDYHSNSCTNGDCGHYTQVVWRESVRLGCARVLCKNGGAFITCNYDPPGNYIGERPY
ncbi:pathogenesis-related protein 1A [Beta vulgaris subsp. vulgaris]|uniref:pathogenesis-related protein 1A n=1 Tax=Beta vulgaris subsp. vulgaris TaxID=3555 RepID=UPI0020371138|nr:pathogenesis-related protein 1A [Beta vulgaris subsp. vulgaris]